ncbi:MAG: AraC family transcriptional regulator [Fusicatenibacter sp.]|nr:AraC family transcriptional regulator [Fusicatenibacter sp.]
MNNNLYEYIDPITSPFEAFCFDSQKDRFPIPAHWHYYVELLYILEGTPTLSIDDTTCLCAAGSAVLFPPKCVHSIGFSNSSGRIRYHVVKFDPDVLPVCKTDALNLRSCLHSIDTSVCPCFFTPQQSASMELLPVFEEIMRECDKKAYGYTMILTADLRKIVVTFVRFWQKGGHSLSQLGIHPSYELSFDLISEYIDTHYFEDLTASKLASMCNMSHSTFSMNFRRRYGMTCKEYITATRINVAENMLLFSSHDIAFIAQEVGYSDCSYFIRCYKQRKGITPMQARKARR